MISTFQTRSEKLITNYMRFNRRVTFMDWAWHHTETTDLAVLPCNSLDTYWLLCTTAGGQLTSRSRLKPLHIVSQGRVPTHSGQTSSSQSTTVLDICMVGWTGAEHELTVGLVCASTHPDLDTTYRVGKLAIWWIYLYTCIYVIFHNYGEDVKQSLCYHYRDGVYARFYGLHIDGSLTRDQQCMK